MMNKCINISYSCNDNYVLPLCCSIQSLAANYSGRINIYILCSDSLSDNSKNYIKMLETKDCEINFKYVNKELFKSFYLQSNTHITRETYYRYLLPDLFPNIDKILYMDCDTIILNDISEIFDENIERFYMAGVDDFSSKTCKKRLNLNVYCNAGVLLFNLKKLREDKLSDKLVRYTIEHSDAIPFQDQDVMNVVFQNNIKMLDKKWNVQLAFYSKYSSNVNDYLRREGKILHYICGIKPWHYEYKSLYKQYFFKYFSMLPKEIQYLILSFPPNKKRKF